MTIPGMPCSARSRGRTRWIREEQECHRVFVNAMGRRIWMALSFRSLAGSDSLSICCWIWSTARLLTRLHRSASERRRPLM